MNNKKVFSGFPAKTDYTSIPNPFFSTIMPQINDLAELKVTLYIFWALYRKKGYPKYISYSEMRSDQALMSGLKASDSAEEHLQNALSSAVKRGTLLQLSVERDNQTESLYLLNTEKDRKVIEQIENGEVDLPGIVQIEPVTTEERPDIFSLYEQHIGLLTPLIADDLKEAEKDYPASWIEEAFRESARMNKRSWRYISKILERWASEGKDDGRTRENSQEDISPKEYIRKFGHLTKKD